MSTYNDFSCLNIMQNATFFASNSLTTASLTLAVNIPTVWTNSFIFGASGNIESSNYIINVLDITQI